MADDAYNRLLEIHRRWIGYVQPIGLLVAPVVLVQHGIGADSNVGAEQVRLAEYVTPGTDRVADIPTFLHDMLGWQPNDIVPAPDTLAVSLPELGTTLRPTYAVPDPTPVDGQPPWQMLIGVEPDGTDLDAIDDAGRAWAATPHARFERLLRATEIHVGLLTNGTAFRLVHAPRGEASGHGTFRIAAMLKTDGRPILSAFLMLLRSERLFGHPDDRLPRLLEESRRYQSEVSAALAEQVLEGLYELLRGLHAADLRTGATRLVDQVRRDPDHIYAGLLTVMMRLVFVLYAEHRGLFPDDTVWAQNYALAGLYERLRGDAALHPDTMDDRYGAWPQLLALFRIVHSGAAHGARLRFVARRGRLFDPDRFPILEGRDTAGDKPVPPRVSDGCVWRILQRLMLLNGERLSYRTLAVEQIGSVYETMMGFTVQLTHGTSLAVRAAKRGGAASVIDLDALLAVPAAKRPEELAKQADRKFGTAATSAVRSAASVVDLERALQSVQDRAATPRPVPLGTPVLQPTPARRRSGSHYTPRSLTEPIVRTTLRPVMMMLGDDPSPEVILELKVLDPAMGSGAFLVEACRQLADALVASWSRRGATPDIPSDEDPLIHAQRLVAQRCLYGVDQNPMAVDIAHLSLWLATLAKEHEFTFLSHALRAGDSLVGLTVDQIAALNWDAGSQAMLASGLVRPKIERAEQERAHIRAAMDWMGEADLRPLLDRADAELAEVRRIGDGVIGAYFSAENDRARRERRGELADAYDAAGEVWLDRVSALAQVPHRLTPSLSPFHWPVEFPEVFDRHNPGFDAVVGNPPFAGAVQLTRAVGERYSEFLREYWAGAHGQTDLAAFFFRRSFELLRERGCLGLIATNTIAQGDTRESGLSVICENGGHIYNVTKRVRWPGRASVIVSRVHISKGVVARLSVLSGRHVERINAFLFHAGGDRNPLPLNHQPCVAGKGIVPWGMGFVFEDGVEGGPSLREMEAAVAANPSNKQRIRRFIGGADLNAMPNLTPERFIIDLDGLEEDEARKWPELFAILEQYVRPQRLALPETPGNRRLRQRWWHYSQGREIREATRGLDRVLLCSQTSKRRAFAFIDGSWIFDQKAIGFARADYGFFAVMQSSLHGIWSDSFGSTMKDDPVYTPPKCFDTFPFPKDWCTQSTVSDIGRACYEFRATMMIRNNEGLTRTYNRFHDPDDCAKDIVDLRALHAAMDRAVLNAYGWTDFHPIVVHEREWETEEGEQLAPWRLRWPEADRDEVLARLLDLNRIRHEEESRDISIKEPSGKRQRRKPSLTLQFLLD